VANLASGEIGPTQSNSQLGSVAGNYLENVGARAVGDIVNREVSVALGDRHVPSWAQVGEDVAGNALGNAAVLGIRAYEAQQAKQAQQSNRQPGNDTSRGSNQPLSPWLTGNNSDVSGGVWTPATTTTPGSGPLITPSTVATSPNGNGYSSDTYLLGTYQSSDVNGNASTVYVYDNRILQGAPLTSDQMQAISSNFGNGINPGSWVVSVNENGGAGELNALSKSVPGSSIVLLPKWVVNATPQDSQADAGVMYYTPLPPGPNKNITPAISEAQINDFMNHQALALVTAPLQAAWGAVKDLGNMASIGFQIQARVQGLQSAGLNWAVAHTFGSPADQKQADTDLKVAKAMAAERLDKPFQLNDIEQAGSDAFAVMGVGEALLKAPEIVMGVRSQFTARSVASGVAETADAAASIASIANDASAGSSGVRMADSSAAGASSAADEALVNAQQAVYQMPADASLVRQPVQLDTPALMVDGSQIGTIGSSVGDIGGAVGSDQGVTPLLASERIANIDGVPEVLPQAIPTQPLWGACFLAGTKIHTQNGIKLIEEIAEGDWVAARNQYSHKTTWRPVLQVFASKDKEIVHVQVEHPNGIREVISATTEHPFYVTGNGWCGAGALNPGDSLELLQGGQSRVVGVAPDGGRHVVYNFEVADDHTYFVGVHGVWVHNTSSVADALRQMAANGGEVVPNAETLENISRSDLGGLLGRGGNKYVYAYGDNQAVGVLIGSTNPQVISDEINMLGKLHDAGIPTVNPQAVSVDGSPGMLMDRFAQGSKDVVRLVDGKVRIVGDSSLLNQQSVADLQAIRDKMVTNEIKIDDLQFLISNEGHVVVADPLDVHFNTPPSTRNLRMIDLLIQSAQKNGSF
jgi:hypothetical protein